MLDLSKLTTESRNPDTMTLDRNDSAGNSPHDEPGDEKW